MISVQQFSVDSVAVSSSRDLYWNERRPMASQWPLGDFYRTVPDIPSDIDFYRDRTVARPSFQVRSPPPRRRSRERRFRSRSPPRDENEYYRSQNSRNYYKESDEHYQKQSRQRLRNDDNWNRNMNQDRKYHENDRSSKRSPNQSYRDQRHRTETYKGDLSDNTREKERSPRSSSNNSHKTPENRSCKNGDIIKCGDQENTGECISEQDPLLSTEDVSSDDLKDDIINTETEERVIIKQTEIGGGLLISVQIAQKEPKHAENKENICTAHRESGNEKVAEPTQSCVPVNEQRPGVKKSPAKGDFNMEMKELDDKIKAQKAKLQKCLTESLKSSSLVLPETANGNPKNDDHSKNKETRNNTDLPTRVNEDIVEKFENNSVLIKTTLESEKLVSTILENTKKLNSDDSVGHSVITNMSTNGHINGLETNRTEFSPFQFNRDGPHQGNDTDTVDRTKSQTHRSVDQDNNMGKLNQTFQELEKDKSIASWARLLKKAVSSIGQNVVSSKTVVSLSNSYANDKLVESSSSRVKNTEIERSSLVASTQVEIVCSENSPKSSETELYDEAKPQCVMSSSKVNTLTDKHEQTDDKDTSTVNEENKSDQHLTLKDRNELKLIGQSYSNLEQHTKFQTETTQLKHSADPVVQKSQVDDAKTISGNELKRKDSKSKQPEPKVKQINVENQKSTDSRKTVPEKNSVVSKSASSVNKSDSTIKDKAKVNGQPFVHTSTVNEENKVDQHSTLKNKNELELIGHPYSNLEKHTKFPTEANELKPSADPFVQKSQTDNAKCNASDNKSRRNDSKSKQPEQAEKVKQINVEHSTSVKNDIVSKDSHKTVPVKNRVVSKSLSCVNKSDYTIKDKAKVNCEPFVKKPEVVAKNISSKNVKDNTGQLPQVPNIRRHSDTNDNKKSISISADEDTSVKNYLVSKDSQETVPSNNKNNNILSKAESSVNKANSKIKDKAKIDCGTFVKKPEVVAKTNFIKIVKDNTGQLPQLAHIRRLSGTNDNAKGSSISADEDKDRKRRLSAPCEVTRKQDSLKKTEKTPDGKYFILGEKESIKKVEKRKEAFKKLKHSDEEKSLSKKSLKHVQETQDENLQLRTIVKDPKSVYEGEAIDKHDKPTAYSELRKNDKSDNFPIRSEYIQDTCNAKRDIGDEFDMDDFEIIDLRPLKFAETTENAVKPDILDMKNIKEHVEVKYCDDRVVFKGQSQRKKFIERLKPLVDVSDDEKSSQSAQQTPHKPLKRKRKQKVHRPMVFNSEDSSDNDLPESPFKITKKDSDNNNTDNTLNENISILPGINKFMKIDKAVYEKGFDVRHDKILENDDIITTFGLLKPEYLYAKTDMTGHALLGKCVRCKCCNQFFNPLDFTQHHDEASVRTLIAIDKCSMMDYTLCSSDVCENVREVFKHFQDYFHQLRSKRRLSLSDILSSVTAFSSPPVSEHAQFLDATGFNVHTASGSDSLSNQSIQAIASDVDTAPSVKDIEPSNCCISVTDTGKNQNVFSISPSIEANSFAEPVQKQYENKGLTSPPIFYASTPLFNPLTLPLMASGFESTPSTPSPIPGSIHENVKDTISKGESIALEKLDSPASVVLEDKDNVDADPTIDTTDVNEAASSESTDVDEIEKKRSEAIDHLCRLYGINTPNRYTNVALLVTALHIDNTKRYIEDQNTARGNRV